MSDDLVPVTVIGGYLGSGKTTMINRLLAGSHGRRLAVLVNDFGAVNVDVDLIAAHDGDTISLSNGCVCCSIGDALGDAIDEVLALDPPPDQIVIEASGVADPAKVAVYGQGWPGCRLDAVLVTADVETVRARADDRFVGQTVVRQLAGADVLLLTKIDLAAAPNLDSVRRWLAGLVGSVPIVDVVDGAVDPVLLLDRVVGPPAGSIGADPFPADEVFETVTVDMAESVGRAELVAMLERANVVRAKGFVRLIDEGDAPFLVQQVGSRWSIEPTHLQPSALSLTFISVKTSEVDDLRTR